MENFKVEIDNKPMRILAIAALFPPNVIGGAELSAHSLVRWLAARGHDVAVLTTAASADQVVHGEVVDGIRMWRVLMPRPYQMFDFQSAPDWKKPFWHLQDHFDPRNVFIVREIIKAFDPDIASIHIIQGLGHNILAEIGRVNLPVYFTLHDMGLVCIRQSMFVRGKSCESQCFSCRLSMYWKLRCIRKIRRIGYVSPSRANLDQVARFFPIADYPSKVILNVNKYPSASVQREESKRLRLLFVGRVHATKGVDMLLEAVKRVAVSRAVSLTIIGDGPDRLKLESEYAGEPWCRFTGFITQQEISNHIVNSDLLCIPSVWVENSPGVVIHARSLGLPIIGSARGGIPELVDAGISGSLLPPGDVNAWAAEIERLIDAPDEVARWRKNALATSNTFEPDGVGQQIETFMYSLARQCE
ncbi:glycosyltransferase family 4 protein [Xanthobacter sp. KR7-65]|uniref:glycosyltransferase family 4 protein n=1 Tax=Xanthobacter sp. KR7-65 TaxID=3156612 RepID=UPI0032B400EB